MVRKDRVRQILIALQGGEMTLDEALQALKRFPFEDVAFANIDHHRALRRGFPEVVLCQGKKTEHVVVILKRISEEHGTFLATRVEPEMVKAESHFVFDLGAESTQSVELVAAFEHEFKVEMDEDAALEVQTVGDAIDFIAKIAG